MNTSLTTTNARTRPLKSPSERDLEIYKLIKVQRIQQWIVAIKYSLHEPRISQIVKKVHRWIAAGGNPTDPQLRDHCARERVSRATTRLRLQRAVEVASHAVESEPRPLKITRRRYVGGTEVWSEETSRPQPDVNLPAVRLLLKATQALQEFDNEAESNQPPPKQPNESDLLPAVFNLLCTWRMNAESEGRLQPTANVAAHVASLLNHLLGCNLAASSNSLPEVASPSSETGSQPQNLLIFSATSSDPHAPSPDAPSPCENPQAPSPEKSVDL